MLLNYHHSCFSKQIAGEGKQSINLFDVHITTRKTSGLEYIYIYIYVDIVLVCVLAITQRGERHSTIRKHAAKALSMLRYLSWNLAAPPCQHCNSTGRFFKADLQCLKTLPTASLFCWFITLDCKFCHVRGGCEL